MFWNGNSYVIGRQEKNKNQKNKKTLFHYFFILQMPESNSSFYCDTKG